MAIYKHESCMIKPIPNKKAMDIFQKVCIDAKFGLTLNKDENDVRKFILTQTPVLGRIPSIDEIKRAFRSLDINLILNKLDQLDIIHLEDHKTKISAAYPFSGSETFHEILFKEKKYKKIFAMCAIDALGICFMFHSDLSIQSRCYHCSQKIKIEINNNEINILTPRDIVVWCDNNYTCCAATSVCKNWNYFCSREHFEDWKNKNNERKGNLLKIEEAFFLGKLFFENRLGN